MAHDTKLNLDRTYVKQIDIILKELENIKYYAFLSSDIAHKSRMKYEYKRDVIIKIFEKIIKAKNLLSYSFDTHDFHTQKTKFNHLKNKMLLSKEDKFRIIIRSLNLDNYWGKICNKITEINNLEFIVWKDKKQNKERRIMEDILKDEKIIK